MQYGLTLGENLRVLSAGIYHQGFPDDVVVVDTIPEGDITDYLYIDGQYVYEPLPVPEQKPTWQDRIEAQVTYNSMILGTLIAEV